MLRVRKRGAAMSRKPQVVTAGNEVKEQLQNIVNRRKSEQRLVERARIILKCLEGMPLEDIAKQVSVSKVTTNVKVFLLKQWNRMRVLIGPKTRFSV